MAELDHFGAWKRAFTRRHFLRDCRIGLGAIALGSLFGRSSGASPRQAAGTDELGACHYAPRAKRVIFLFMAGAPSQLDLFDPKPKLAELDNEFVPPSFVEGKRFAFIGKNAKLMASPRKFHRHGECGAEVSELLPHIGGISDELCYLRGMTTDAINHSPAKLFLNTGSQLFGRPSMGSWLTYGLGSECDDLPGFVVLQSGGRGPRGGAQLWSSGFLPAQYQGVPLRSKGDPILNLQTPDGISQQQQGEFVETVNALNSLRYAEQEEDEIRARIRAYELAFRMQASAPELMNLSDETAETLALYGAEAGAPSYARNCLLARRLIERGVRFVQLYHTDWDHHGDPNLHLGEPLEEICREVDRPSAALVLDLKRRGLLDDTLVIWGGEFGRTPMSEVRRRIGRDHHIDAYTMWLAGGGVKAGATIGQTDEIGYGVVEGKVHVHDLQATILHLLGLDHEALTYRFQGRDFRLTDVAGEVVHDMLA